MDLGKIKNVYFIGIGGIGMSALARYFHSMGKFVQGYDRTATPLIKDLMEMGIDVHFVQDIDFVDERILSSEDVNNTLVIYTPAVPDNHTELGFFRRNKFKVIKRAEALGIITKNKKGIAIAGTHGKTTVTTMTAHLLNGAELPCDAFLGGISKNFKTNLVTNENAEWVAVEADEFDRSFLTLSPNIALITSIDADHLDIYGSKSNITKAFEEFAGKIEDNGILLVKKGVELTSISELKRRGIEIYYYSLKEKADFYTKKLAVKNGKYCFDLVTPGKVIKGMQLEYPGWVNVENAVAALSIATLLECKPDLLKQSLTEFSGVQRRFDIQFKNNRQMYIDDYAHHPEELKAVISSVKEMYQGKTVLGVFQPHLFTRTRDFADEFAESLSLLDEVVLMEIYPAREEPIPGITSKTILDKIDKKNKFLCNRCEVVNFVARRNYDIILTLGAGDIDKIVIPIKSAFEQKYADKE